MTGTVSELCTAEQSWKTRANILIGRECPCFFNSLWPKFSFFQEPDSVQRGDCAHGQQVCLVADCDKQLLWILLLLVPIKYNRDTDSSRSSCVLTEASKYLHNKITNKITQNMQFFALNLERERLLLVENYYVCGVCDNNEASVKVEISVSKMPLSPCSPITIMLNMKVILKSSEKWLLCGCSVIKLKDSQGRDYSGTTQITALSWPSSTLKTKGNQ